MTCDNFIHTYVGAKCHSRIGINSESYFLLWSYAVSSLGYTYTKMLGYHWVMWCTMHAVPPKTVISMSLCGRFWLCVRLWRWPVVVCVSRSSLQVFQTLHTHKTVSIPRTRMTEYHISKPCSILGNSAMGSEKKMPSEWYPGETLGRNFKKTSSTIR